MEKQLDLFENLPNHQRIPFNWIYDQGHDGCTHYVFAQHTANQEAYERYSYKWLNRKGQPTPNAHDF